MAIEPSRRLYAENIRAIHGELESYNLYSDVELNSSPECEDSIEQCMNMHVKSLDREANGE